MKRRFKRRYVVVGGPTQQSQADLVYMSRLKKVNDASILTVKLVRSTTKDQVSSLGGGAFTQ